MTVVKQVLVSIHIRHFQAIFSLVFYLCYVKLLHSSIVKMIMVPQSQFQLGGAQYYYEIISINIIQSISTGCLKQKVYKVNQAQLEIGNFDP